MNDDDDIENEDDICENYHQGNPESVEANRRTQKSRDARRILHYLWAHPEGTTCDQIEVALGMIHQTASARCSELLRGGAVRRKEKPGGGNGYERAETRTGAFAAILVLNK
jgi:Fic family protein